MVFGKFFRNDPPATPHQEFQHCSLAGRQDLRLIIDECLRVARRDGITLDVDFLQLINDTFRPSRNLSSMHQDLLNGKRTEIDYLNGAVVELGRKYGIGCPANESLTRMVKALEQRV